MTYFLVPRATVVRVEGVPCLEYVESTYRLSKQYREHIPSTSTTATASATGATDKDWSRFTLVLMLAVVTTGCRVRSGRLTRTSRGVDEHLCNESGARLDSQAGDKMY